MELELELLGVLKNRENYERYIDFVPTQQLTDEVNVVLRDMGRYFENKPGATEVDWKDFEQRFKVMYHPNYKQSQHKFYESMFSKLTNYKVSEDTEKELVPMLIDKSTAASLVDAGEEVLAGTKGWDAIEKVLEDRANKSTRYKKAQSKVVSNDLADLLNQTYKQGGLEWRLEDLNVSIGPLRRGDMVVVAGRPDSGKTSMVASEVTHMAPQLPDNKPVLVFNNEEAGSKIGVKAYQAALGKTVDELLADEVNCTAEYVKHMGNKDRVIIYDAPYLTVQEVDRICAEHDPGIIVFNTLKKIKGFSKSSSDVDRQEHLAQWARELAKEYGVVFAVHQVGGEGAGVKFISDDKLYGSKTGIQGEADAIITIGYLVGQNGKRYLHVPKNKMPPGPRTQQIHRNIKSEVYFYGDIARYETMQFTKPSNGGP